MRRSRRYCAFRCSSEARRGDALGPPAGSGRAAHQPGRGGSAPLGGAGGAGRGLRLPAWLGIRQLVALSGGAAACPGLRQLNRAVDLRLSGSGAPLQCRRQLSPATRAIPGGRSLFQRAIAIGEKALGPEHSDLPPATTTWRPCTTIRRYEEAEPLYQRAIAIGEKALGPEHPPPPGHSLQQSGGLLYLDQGRYEEAQAALPACHRHRGKGTRSLSIPTWPPTPTTWRPCTTISVR